MYLRLKKGPTGEEMEWDPITRQSIIHYVQIYGINKTAKLLGYPRSSVGVIAKGCSQLPANKDIYPLKERKSIAEQAIRTQNIRRVSINTGTPRSSIQVWIRKYFTEVEVELYSSEIKSKAIGRFLAGATPTDVAKEFNVPRRTIRGWIEKYQRGILHHAHHWIISPPNGPFSEGKCRYCGKTSMMRNSFEGSGHWMTGKDRRALKLDEVV